MAARAPTSTASPCRCSSCAKSSAPLLDVHGQHEFQSLVRGSAQRELLDRYGRLEPLADEVRGRARPPGWAC